MGQFPSNDYTVGTHSVFQLVIVNKLCLFEMAELWFQDKFSTLQIDDNRLNGLSEIHEKLQALNTEEIVRVLNNVELELVLACIDSTRTSR